VNGTGTSASSLIPGYDYGKPESAVSPRRWPFMELGTFTKMCMRVKQAF
jgi:hypothetical protein